MMTNPDAHRFYDLVHVRPQPEDLHYAPVTPDLQYRSLSDVEPERIAELGADHVLLDLDGTLVPTHMGGIYVPETLRPALQRLLAFGRFESVSVATENGSSVSAIRRGIGARAINVFSSHYARNDDELRLPEQRWKTKPAFWKYILFELDILDEPHRAVMIGDSPARDILPAQAAGLRTVQVDRLERRMKSAAEIRSMLGRSSDPE